LITKDEVVEVLGRYNKDEITLGMIGSHSALDIADGAKDEGFRTVVICQRGREKPYLSFRRLYDEYIMLPKFKDALGKEVQDKLRRMNTIFIPHRSFVVYLGYDGVEKEFLVPIFGNRALFRAEERDMPRNQYYLLEKAGIKYPKVFERPEDIDRPVLVKVMEKRRKIERAFFIASSYEDYVKKAKERIEKGLIGEEDLKKAKIEELAIGTYFNFNFFYSPLDEELQLMGIDRRLQTNLYDFVNYPARRQLEIDIPLQNIEVGHMPATIRESLLEKVFEAGERFVDAVRREYPPGIIGPFALQSVINTDLELVVYDVSLRMPGSPIIATTSPYSKHYFGEVVSMGRRVAMELKKAIKEERLEEVVT